MTRSNRVRTRSEQLVKERRPADTGLISVVIPALNEERSIGLVISDLKDTARKTNLQLYIIVCDNGSTDQTAPVARKAGALVVQETERGYGAACLRGLAHLPAETEIVLFIDADYSDFPEEFPLLVRPIADGQAELVIGSRTAAGAVRERGSLTIQQRFGNWLSTFLIRLLYGVRYTDLGPFRAISAHALHSLDMRDRNFGWTVEMQIKAARMRLRSEEVPVSYRKRIGISKISGTIKGTVMAGTIILGTIFREYFNKRNQ
ncbi:MAG: glycosyltransferase family 2 protein [Spirochaetota bacterium]